MQNSTEKQTLLGICSLKPWTIQEGDAGAKGVGWGKQTHLRGEAEAERERREAWGSPTLVVVDIPTLGKKMHIGGSVSNDE